jgi:hypothetical protein
MVRYRLLFDIVVDRYRLILHSISCFSRFRAFDIVLQNIRCRISYRISISKVIFGRSISTQYRDVLISSVRRSISSVAKVPDGCHGHARSRTVTPVTVTHGHARSRHGWHDHVGELGRLRRGRPGLPGQSRRAPDDPRRRLAWRRDRRSP